MKRTDDRMLPVLLLTAQALVWPGVALLRGEVPTATQLLAAALTGLVVAGALAARRAHPVPALAVTVAACALSTGVLPSGGTAVLGTAGVALALYTVALLRDTVTALLTVGTLALWQAQYLMTLHSLGAGNGLDLVLTAVLYVAAVGAGVRRRRARADRRAAERRLDRAASERHRLPAAERRRVERELHDVSAHHLTAVVVSAGVALGLREKRPELTGEALTLAVGTGRQVTEALGAVRAPAPELPDSAAPRERLLALVEGVRRLGQPVSCELSSLPDGSAGEVVHGIVREALTNAVRHVPGAPTSVECREHGGGHQVTVRNERPGQAEEGAASLGGGRGQAFLHSRAREAGGTLRSGPGPDGSWSVTAWLPGPDGGLPHTPVPRARRVAQVLTAAVLCLNPLLPFLAVRSADPSPGSGAAAGVLFTLLAAAQAVVVLWARQSPRGALVTVLVLAALWPAGAAAGYGGPALVPALLAAAATCAAVAVLASRTAGAAPGPRPLWPVVAVVGQAAVGVLLVGTAPVETAPPGAVAAVALPALAVAAAWWLGRRQGRRRTAAQEANEDRITAWTGEAVRDAWGERVRITSGLETTVLARTAEMVREAENGRLEETAERAREALAAMRALLDSGGATQEYAERRPQPTLQALDLLVRQSRAAGRDVAAAIDPGVPRPLPSAVDIAAYRAAETLLTAGGEGPAELRVEAGAGCLTLRATGVRALRPEQREELTARAAALGGTLSTGSGGTAELRLPLEPPAADAPAVAERAPSPPQAGEGPGQGASGTGRTVPTGHGDEEDPRCPSQ
ncbi:histidine kinase [Streptomyces sp. SM14]|uniref:ATP-binding protein n=2 Tax=unclassified Streptomyces TaxID=2593676 RepID=UPI000CD52A25|nr:histidine kinase [Streptomyces sp. SM14]